MAPPTDMAVQLNNSMDTYRVPQAKPRMERDMQLELDLQRPKTLQDADRKQHLQELTSAVEEMNRQAQNMRRSLQFSIERDLNLTVVKVVNPHTEEVIRQIPSEEFIAIARAFEESRSHLFDAEV